MSGKRSNGEGSIYWDESKQRYRASLTLGYRNGKPIRRTVTGTTKAKAAQRLRELRQQLDRGQLTAKRPPTVEEWITYWLDNIAVKRCKPLTMQGYRSKMDQYVIPLLGHHRLDKLTPEHVEQAWDEIQEVGNPIKSEAGTAFPLSGTTALQTHRILSRALKVAVQRDRAPRNVCTLIDAPQAAEAEVEAMTPEEARKVLAFCQDVRNAARWSVALSLGLRQGEALGLRWSDLELDTGVLHVRQALARVTGKGLVLQTLKSKRSKRSLPMPPELLVQIKAHKKTQNEERLAAGSDWQDHDLVFCQLNGKPIDPRGDWKAWQAVLAGAGVRRYRLHDARHTAATLLLLQGVSTRTAMDVLGHSQISVTTKYQHVVDELLRDAAQRMGAALWPGSSAAE